MKPSATLKQISQTLGISISTVSRALKNHPDISVATKKKVAELSEILEYEPNTNAVNLRTNNSKLFGVIVPVISGLFYDSVIVAIEEEARLHGISLIILQSSDDPKIEAENLKLCKQNRVRGIFISICAETKDYSDFNKLIENEIPIIFIDKVPSNTSFNKICVADAKAAILAAEALFEKKKKTILSFFGNSKMSITKERLLAYETFFKDKKGMKLLIKEALNPNVAYVATKEAFSKKQKPDAIFCMSDEILTGVMKAIQELELRLPNDVGVIAISNGYIPHLYYPDITYVETSGYKLGKLAYSRMMACLAGSSFTQNFEVSSILVNGGSL
ncbi:MAG: LacI family DNA-binding transcriptional regulator [Chitinophagaceae bacterium]